MIVSRNVWRFEGERSIWLGVDLTCSECGEVQHAKTEREHRRFAETHVVVCRQLCLPLDAS